MCARGMETSLRKQRQTVTGNLAPSKTKRLKGNAQERFHGEVLENIFERDQLFKKLERSQLYAKKKLCGKARNATKFFYQNSENNLKINQKKILANHRFGEKILTSGLPNNFAYSN